PGSRRARALVLQGRWHGARLAQPHAVVGRSLAAVRQEQPGHRLRRRGLDLLPAPRQTVNRAPAPGRGGGWTKRARRGSIAAMKTTSPALAALAATLLALGCTSNAKPGTDGAAGAGGAPGTDGLVASDVVTNGFVAAGPWAGYGFTATDPG